MCKIQIKFASNFANKFGNTKIGANFTLLSQKSFANVSNSRHLSANCALKICVNFVVYTKIAYIYCEYCEFAHIFRQFFVYQMLFCVVLRVWAQFWHQKRELWIKILCTKFSAKFLVQWSSNGFSFLILAIFVQF